MLGRAVHAGHGTSTSVCWGSSSNSVVLEGAKHTPKPLSPKWTNRSKLARADAASPLESPHVFRDCLDCGVPEGMTLQNVAVTVPISIPLLYACTKCGATFTQPPPVPPKQLG